MHLKKMVLILICFFFCSFIYAEEMLDDDDNEFKNFNFFIGLGNEYIKNFRVLNINNTDYFINRFVTTHAFYSLFDTDLGSPIIGVGFNYSYVNKNSKNLFYNSDIIASVGFKFDLYQELSLYTLGNFGFGIDNKYRDSMYNLPFFTKYSGGLMLLVSYTLGRLIHIGLGGQLYKNYFTVVFQNQQQETGNFDSGYLVLMLGFSI